MAYYDDHEGYVGYDPYDAHDRRVHEERYHKSEVPTTKELTQTLYYRGIVEESKKYRDEPSYDGDDFFTAYMAGFEKVIYESLGDPQKTMGLLAKDAVKNKDTPRLIATDKEHIIKEGMKTWIVYKINDGGLTVLGVFYDERYAEKFIKTIEE